MRRVGVRQHSSVPMISWETLNLAAVEARSDLASPSHKTHKALFVFTGVSWVSATCN